ncbi:hypothetical protein BGZ49_005535 [Haplosporangium sp. Z 27]|nr:hypothetical protein BGZ49_005535 [Haplosporangium sp. Z 27]
MVLAIHKRTTFIFVFVFFFGTLFTLHQVLHQSGGDPTICDRTDDHCLAYRPEVKLAFITSFFRGRDEERQEELDICITNLIGCQVLNQVHILIEKADVPALPPVVANSPKVKTSIIRMRPKMGDYIQYACDNLQDYRVLFANSDISYDLTLEYFTKMSDKIFDNTFYAISRWWLSEKGMTPSPYPEWGSYDTFVFSPKTLCADKRKLGEIVRNLNYTLGISGAENRLLYEVKQQFPDMQMINPVYTVKSVHHHQSSYRAENYNNYVHKDGKSVSIDPPFIV